MSDATESEAKALSSNRNQLILLGCAAGVIIGSLGQWATVWIITVNGTSGDGMYTLVAGAITGLLAFLEFNQPSNSRGRYIAMMLLFIACAGLGAYTWANIGDLANRSEFATQVGWGLPLLTISAGIGALVTYIQLGEINQNTHVEAYDPTVDIDLPHKSYRTIAVVAIVVSALIVIGSWGS